MKRALRAWVLLRLPVPLLLLAVGHRTVAAWVSDRLTRMDYAHGYVKMALIAWHSWIVRADRLLFVTAALAVGGAVLVGLTGRRWPVVYTLVALISLAVLRPLTAWTIPLAFALYALHTSPPLPRLSRLGGLLAWLPGSELVVPGLVATAIDAGPRMRRLAGAFGGIGIALLWIAIDTSASFWEYEHAVFAPWPDERVDTRVTTLARAPADVKSDFHDIDIVGDRAVVVAESSLRLLNVAADGTLTEWPLSPWWGVMEGLAMDSETDPASGTSWYLSGPNTVTGVRWDGAAWTKVAESPALSEYLHHTYAHWMPDRSQLFLFTIGTHNTLTDSYVVELDTPDLQAPTLRRLRLRDGSRPPPIRDIVWVPTIGRFVLAPDFGDHLYTLQPGRDEVTPWMKMPTLNGKLTWVPELGRLFVPVPNAMELWIVDPNTATIERRLPTQPGVRTVAVDSKRGLVITASVVTGQVLVQRLDTGAIVDHFGTVMPMVRSLVLIPERGEALLSTWTALYRIPYAAEAP